jgi:hypothetical protein
MVDITEISAMVAAAGVLVGVVYYILDLRHNTRAREMELARMAFSDYISEQAIGKWATMMNMQWKDNKDFMEKYGESNPEMVSKWTSWFFAWEMAGIFLKNKTLEAEVAHDIGGYSAIFAWEKFKDIIQEYRDNTVWGQDYLSNAEFYAQEMLKIKMKKDPTFKNKWEAYKKALKA